MPDLCAQQALLSQGAASGIAAAEAERWRSRVEQLHDYWQEANLFAARDWDISPVMLAASVLPGAWLRHPVRAKPA